MKPLNEMTVVLVDDTPLQVIPWRAELAVRGIRLVIFHEADDCINFVEKDTSGVDLLILDIQLPSRKRYLSEDTDHYNMTGLLLAYDIRRISKAPILFVSNYTRGNTLKRIDKAMQIIGNCAFLQKGKIEDPEDFGHELERVLTDGVEALNSWGLLDRMARSLIVRPTIPGVGVGFDIKEFLKSR